VTIRTLLLALATLCAVAVGRPAAAQQIDIIRGRVTGADTLPLQGVLVTATTLTGNVSRTARTDRNGRYTISFPGGEGNYWVTFTAIGFAARRYQVLRTADQEILIADARMAPAAVTLEAVRVVDRQAASRADTVADVGGTERSLDADPGFLTAEQMGDLAAMAAAVPGVQLLPGADGAADAFSVFGLSGDQNNTQLNGLNFGDASLPRDGGFIASLNTAPYDVARGGFSGGQLQLRTRSGSNFQSRAMSSNLVAPPMQWVDRAGIATGQQYTNISVGGSMSGPFVPDRAFYNTSFQYDRSLRDLQTLLNSSGLGFQTAGVSADSVARLLDILGGQAVPVTVDGFPGQRINDRGSFLGAFDYVPQNSSRGNTYAISITGNLNRTAPAGGAGGFGGFGGGAFGGGGGAGNLITPARDGTRFNWGAGAQARQSGLLGWGGIFTETNVGYNISRQDADPYYRLPAGSVRVNSLLDDGSNAVRSLGFGGSPTLNTASANRTASFLNTLSWFSSDNRHRVKLTSELRHDSYWQDLTNNQFGTFTFNSLEELQAGVPATFTRQLAPRRREGSQMVGALSLGDAWRPVNDLQVQYGLRLDGNKFLVGPTPNPEIQTLFGRNNGDVPSRLYLSPRIGFSWTYGTADQVALLPGMVRAPRAVVRGGIGVFQNTPGTQSIGGAIDNTGLPTGLQQLNCVGAAAPIPDWTSYLNDVNSIPRTCADGSLGTVFSNSTPNVTLFDPDFAAQRSLRSNLQWSGAVLKNRFAATVDATWSRNQRQQGSIDLNFPGTTQFLLANEAGRPVFVTPAAIVPATGAIAWRESRKVDAYGRVTQLTSNLESESRQLTVSLRPLNFSSRLNWSVSYVLADVREQFLGFSSTVGDPNARDWSRGSFFTRHQFQYSLSYNFLDAVRVSWFGNIRSGTPYTPLIGGDVNGDSYNNDRAFIFDPAAATTDPRVAAGVRALLESGTVEARRCLEQQLGRLAQRNSCTGPWTTGANLSISFNPLKIGLPQRATLSFQVANPLGGLDRLVNGEDNLKGWGQVITPDPQLLYVRGFDRATQRFAYEVNERFGSTRVSQSAVRQPTSVTALLRYDLGPTRERQQLLQQLDRGRTRPGNKPSVQQLRFAGNTGLINPMQQILQQSDTLKLTRRQADSLATLNRWYILKSDSIWAPVARELAELPDRYSHDLAYDRYRRAREHSVDLLIAVVPGVKTLLTPEQFRLLPTSLQGFLDKRTLQGIRSGTAGQSWGGFGGMGGMGGGFGGGGFGGGGMGGRR
jgi:hypothetical protein